MNILEGRYRLVEQLGKGGFGAVWLAHDERLGGLCAVKQSHLGRPELAQILESEAAILANLSHPSLPRIRDHFVADDCAYLVMDYVEGGDLAMLLANEPRGIAPARVVEWTNVLADAIQYLHTLPQPVLHRDIKPSNIKLTPDGRLVLLDFGIAREVTAITIGLRHAITPGYSPPEQYRGVTEPRSDVYALAATVYALLTGHAPTAAHARLAGEALAPPSAVRSELPVAFDAPLLAALDLEPENRPSTPLDFARTLNAALFASRNTYGTTQFGPTTPIAPITPTPRRRVSPLLLVGAGLLALFGVGGLVWSLLGRNAEPVIALSPTATLVPTLAQPTIAPRPTIAPAPTASPVPLVTGIGGVLYVGQKDADEEYQIYRVPTNGEPATALTSIGSNYGAQLSPDGSQIAFTSERDGREQIYVMNVDGSEQRRVSSNAGLSQYCAWSPDGQSVVYSYSDDSKASQDDDGWRIVTQRLDSAEQRVIADMWGTWPSWGVAGIVFTSREIVDGAAQLSLTIVQPDGSDVRVINPTRNRDEHYPNWSADGSRLLFVAGDSKGTKTRQVWIMNADGTDARPLTSGLGGVAMPTWSPDEQQVIFLAKWGGTIGDEAKTQFNLWIVPVAGGIARPFTVNTTAKFGLAWGE